MMKLCIIVLSLGGMIGGLEKYLDSHFTTESKPQVVFSQAAPLLVSSISPPDSQRAIEDALAEAKNSGGGL